LRRLASVCRPMANPREVRDPVAVSLRRSSSAGAVRRFRQRWPRPPRAIICVLAALAAYTTTSAPAVAATASNATVVGMAASLQGGYWMVASDGGVFTFGAAQFYGSMGGKSLIIAAAAHSNCTSYTDPSTGQSASFCQ